MGKSALCVLKKMITVGGRTILWSLRVLMPLGPVHSEPPKNNTHYTYIGNREGIAETFYQNNSFFQCIAKQHCKPSPEGQPRKKFAIMLKDKKTNLVLPAFLKCFNDGRAVVSLSEDLIGTANKILQSDDPNCLDYSTLAPQADAQAIQDTVAAVEKLGDQCPQEDRSCLGQLYDLFEQDVKNTVQALIPDFLYSAPPDATSKMGCLSNILANFKNSIVSVLKTFLYDAPKKLWEIGKAAWDYFFDQEKKSSTVAFLSSMMSTEMATALVDWDLPNFYNLLRANFFKTFGAIRQFYLELIGCTEWSGEPFYSECLKKMNFSCTTCENVTQFTCGLLGQLGAGVALGGLMGTLNSVGNVIKSKVATSGKSIAELLVPVGMRESVKNSAIAQGLRDLANAPIMQEISAKASQLKHGVGEVAYRMGLKVSPLTKILASVKDELKLILGMGDAFKNVVAGNPITSLYHFSYQKGKKITQQKVSNTLVQRGVVGMESAILKAKKYAYHLQKIWDLLESHLAKLQQMSDPKKFNPKTYQKIISEYLKRVQEELEHIGFKVSPASDGKGLLLEKGGESIVYRPDFEVITRRKFKNVEELQGHIKTHDALLHDGREPRVVASNPPMIQDVLESAKNSLGLYAASADGLDGFVYLAHLGVLPSQSRQPPKCTDILLEAKLLGVEDISEVVKEPATTGVLLPLEGKSPAPVPAANNQSGTAVEAAAPPQG